MNTPTLDFGTKVDGDLPRKLFAACQRNAWLKVGGADFSPHGFCLESDYPLALYSYESRDDLKAFFVHGNWGIRSAVQFGDLIFVNQVNGGDEWWTLKIFDGRLVPFESVSWGHMLERPDRNPRDTFDGFLDRLIAAAEEQIKKGEY